MPAAPLPELRLSLAQSLAEVPQAHWDRLLAPDDQPLLSWAYLQALERSACVGPHLGWRPLHLLLHHGPDLVAAAPAYVKDHSDAEWVFDMPWADFAAQQDLPYYPKLVLCVPFNPVTGSRLLCRKDLPQQDQLDLQRTLLAAAMSVCRSLDLSSAHLHFQRDAESAACRAAGFALRRQEQYHFLNPGYRSFDDFLSHLRPHRRNTIRRERRALLDAGVRVRTARGLRDGDGGGGGSGDGGGAGGGGFSRQELDAVFDMYVATSLRYTGEPPFLSRPMFHLLADRLGDRLELVLAEDQAGTLLAGAVNLRGDTRLLGRYWGYAQNVPFLHFEVCFYHSIERCIRDGLLAFEPGHGGDQKLLRGFQPVYTYSAHHFVDPRFDQTIQWYVQREAPLVEESLRLAQRRCPVRDLPELPALAQPPTSAPSPGRRVHK